MQAIASRKVEITLATAEHGPALEAFFRSVWRATAAGGAQVGTYTGARPPSEPTAPTESAHTTTSTATPGVVALVDGEVVGYLGTLPLHLWERGQERSAHWFKGFMVLPQYRNGPLGFALAKEAARHVAIACVITVQPASWRLFKAVGLSHVGALENWLRLLRPDRVLANIDPAAVGLGRLPLNAGRGLAIAQRLGVAAAVGLGLSSVLRAYAFVRSLTARGFDVRAVDSIDGGEYDALWMRTSAGLRFAQVRDAEYVRRRYLGVDRSRYSLIEVREGPTLVGFGALRHPSPGLDARLAGLSVGVVSDVLVHPVHSATAALAVLTGCDREARRLGTDALVCSGSHPTLLSALSAAAYFRIPATLQFLARLGPGVDSGALDEWWLCRADGNADEGF